jgi:hypothetical protein
LLWWLDSIYGQAWNGNPLNDLLKEKETINGLNLMEIQRIARKYLFHDINLMRGVHYPDDIKK